VKKKRRILLGAMAVFLSVLVIWTVWGNTALELNRYTVASDRLPEGFDGYRIAHVSDLHNTEMGKENEKLLTVLREAEPDIIAITGDLIDCRRTDIEVALQFTAAAMEIAPCYFVAGNHEARISGYDELKERLTEQGVIILEDARVNLEQSGETIVLLGVNDPGFPTDSLGDDSGTVMTRKLQALSQDKDGFTILLSHRPELFESYVDGNIDLVLSGHAHGGQFRIPFVGGVLVPNQGWFPEYDAGLFEEKATTMIVSRGIGNSVFPFRFNNRPEVILIELESEESK